MSIVSAGFAPVRAGAGSMFRMDRVELARLYQAHADGVYSFLRHLTGSEDQAFDLLQDVFLRAAGFTGQVRHEKAWLFKIARNLAYDSFRRNRETALPDEGPAVADAFTDAVNWKELRARILARLSAEDEVFVRVFLLRLDHEMTQADIALVLGLGERTVRRTIEKIKTILKSEFGDELFGERRPA